MSAAEKLAIHGGIPVRTDRFTKRRPFGQREIELVTEAINSQDLFVYGTDMVKRMETAICGLYGTHFAVATTSGTAALHLAIGAVGLNPGDEVITTPITDMGTIIPILLQNGVPIFADTTPGTLHMDPKEVQRHITKRTRAIILVHPVGNPVDVEPFIEIAREHNLLLIEDCCQSHATYLGAKHVGTYGHIGCFSLQQSKQLATGDGGFVITDDPMLADMMRRFTDKGWLRQQVSEADTGEILAPNYRITSLQAAVAIAQIEKASERIAIRHRLGSLLTELISNCDGLGMLQVLKDAKPSYWFYPFFTWAWPAQTFAKALSVEGIPASTGMFIGKPIFLCSATLYDGRTYGDSHFPFGSSYTTRQYKELYAPGVCPNAEYILDHTVMLTIHEQTEDSEIADMAKAIRKVAAGLERLQ